MPGLAERVSRQLTQWPYRGCCKAVCAGQWWRRRSPQDDDDDGRPSAQRSFQRKTDTTHLDELQPSHQEIFSTTRTTHSSGWRIATGHRCFGTRNQQVPNGTTDRAAGGGAQGPHAYVHSTAQHFGADLDRKHPAATWRARHVGWVLARFGYVAEIMEPVLFNLHSGTVGMVEPPREKELWLGRSNASDQHITVTVEHGSRVCRRNPSSFLIP